MVPSAIFCTRPDAVGRVVYQTTNKKDVEYFENMFELSNITTGIYTIEILTNTEKITKQIIIE